jgi:4-amino-4-deoxy-L-arabinose transferase-like glycosyltransferase
VTRSGRLADVLRWLTIAVVAVFALATTFAAVVVPYRLWDSLAFGSWSRSIAKTGDLWSGTDALNVSRPLFYVPQGLIWWVAGDEWIGRLLSACFAAVLVAAVWQLARQVAPQRPARDLVPHLTVLGLLSSAVLATYAAAGMTDVPVAAASAATAVALWSRLSPRALVPLAALGAAATILAKPSGLLALAGLALATVVLRRRAAILGLAGLAIGIAVALLYDAWQAARLDAGLGALLRAGNDDFWLERGAAVRFDAIVGGAWLGEGARLLVLYGLAHGLARAGGASARVSLAVGVTAAAVWSVAGPLVADGELGYPFDGSVLGIIAWIVVVAALGAAPFLATEDPAPRSTHVALLLWLAPIGLVWATQRPDEPRLLAPAWPAFALLTGLALASASLALLRFRRRAVALAPAAAVALVALANVVSVDGLGREGWRSLLDLGPSGWRDRAEMENFAYGPFSYQLDLARENVRSGDRIASSDGRLKYFFPGQVEVSYASRCSELEGARFFSFLSSGESLEFAELQRQPTDPLSWVQCAHPTVRLIGEQSGIYAAFVVGGPPARPPVAEDCHIEPTAGQLLDAVFGSELGYAEASELAQRALDTGFQGARVERTGCDGFRVVVTGIPDDPAVQREFRAETAGAGFHVTYAPAARYPEVGRGIPPVPP